MDEKTKHSAVSAFNCAFDKQKESLRDLQLCDIETRTGKLLDANYFMGRRDGIAAALNLFC